MRIRVLMCAFIILAFAWNTQAQSPTPKIVNGLWTQAEPTTGAMVFEPIEDYFCSATLVGCQTVITAAHCVCGGTGAECQGANAPDPTGIAVYFQNVGRVAVESIAVHPDYDFGAVGHDIAVVKLAEPVTGVKPTPFNNIANPSNGTATVLAGFGTDDSQGGGVDGIKRTVKARTASCQGIVPQDQHLCYEFSSPVGLLGEDGSSCFGDSGGPTFADINGQTVLAGVTSGGFSCKPPGAFGFDTNVFANRDWLAAQIGGDLNPSSCPGLPTVGSDDTSVEPFHGYLHPNKNTQAHTFTVAPQTDRLRVTLNRAAQPGSSVMARVRFGNPPTEDAFDCVITNFSGCEISSPQAGDWFAEVEGGGDYQLTATLFFPAGSGRGAGDLPSAYNPTDFCVPSIGTLCVDQDDFDRRFQVAATFDTTQGQGGSGRAFLIDVAAGLRGGLMWFFSPDNPEMLVKVLNGCEINNHVWVFVSAVTTVGVDLQVIDRVTGAVWNYSNDDRTQAQPVSDTAAFSCGGSSSP